MESARKENPAAALNGHTLYHCSPVVYAKPCYEKMAQHVRENDKHPNGVLGLWLSNKPELCIQGFGPYVYETELDKNARHGLLPLKQLRDWHDVTNKMESIDEQVAFYVERRRELLERLDVFVVTDCYWPHDIGEVVVANLDVITRHEIVPWKPKRQVEDLLRCRLKAA